MAEVAYWPITSDIALELHVGFSNRPFGVKHFQTIHHHCSVDVAHGLVLLFGIGTKALPSIMGFEDEVEPSLRRPCR